MSVKKRIAVVGLYQSGKTVFLTSLINHMCEHEPLALPMGRGDLRLCRFVELPPSRGFAEFDYYRYRQALVDGHRWPVKTRATSEYRCRFLIKGGRKSKEYELGFLDIPGERLADMTMVGQSFGEWSKFVLRVLDVRPEYRVHAAEFLGQLDERQLQPAAVIDAYKKVLSHLILNYKPLVTPSAFLVDPSGSYPRARDVDELVRQRCSGLTAQQQFTPLNHQNDPAHEAVRNVFSEHFEEYKRRLANPLADWLRNCHVLVVLVDVTMLLAGGIGMYEGHKELVSHLIRAADPGASRAGDLLRKLLWAGSLGQLDWGAIKRIAFVATKADKVHKDDMQRLEGLLRRMTRRLVDGIDGVTAEWFVCSAVDSTVSHDNGQLEGYLMDGDKRGQATQLYQPALVPDDWPTKWDPENFVFPDVWPVMPPQTDAPPRQRGMHQILNFIMEEQMP